MGRLKFIMYEEIAPFHNNNFMAACRTTVLHVWRREEDENSKQTAYTSCMQK